MTSRAIRAATSPALAGLTRRAPRDPAIGRQEVTPSPAGVTPTFPGRPECRYV
jgi:hypothetical protein